MRRSRRLKAEPVGPSHHHVYDSARDDDNAAWRLARERALDGIQPERRVSHTFLVGIASNLDFAAALAVHLYRNRDGVAPYEIPVCHGPARLGNEGRMPQRFPAGLSQMHTK